MTIIHKNRLPLTFIGFVKTASAFAVVQIALAAGVWGTFYFKHRLSIQGTASNKPGNRPGGSGNLFDSWIDVETNYGLRRMQDTRRQRRWCY